MMAFNATSPLLADAYKRLRDTAFSVKKYAESRSSLFANGATESEILATVDNLTTLRDIMVSISSTPGISDYAKIQEDDINYNVVTEYLAMITAINAVLLYITNNIPAPRTFTDVQLAPLKADVDALVLTIN